MLITKEQLKLGASITRDDITLAFNDGCYHIKGIRVYRTCRTLTEARKLFNQARTGKLIGRGNP